MKNSPRLFFLIWLIIGSLGAFGASPAAAGTLLFDGVPVDITTSPDEDLVIVPGEGGNTQIGDKGGENTYAVTNDDLHVTGVLEVDGAVYADSAVTISGALGVGGSLTAGTLATSFESLKLNPAAGYGIISSASLSGASGNETAFSFAVTVNKLNSGNYTGLKLNVTETAAPGLADKLLDLQAGGVPFFQVFNTAASANYGLLSAGSGAWDGETEGAFTGHEDGTVIAANAPAGYSGNLLDLQIAGVSKFKVDSDGNIIGSVVGGVTGPDLSTDNAVAVFDGEDGGTIKNSGVLIDGSDNITGVTSLTAVGSLQAGTLTDGTLSSTAGEITGAVSLELGGSAPLTGIQAGDNNNDKLATKGYVDDTVGTISTDWNDLGNASAPGEIAFAEHPQVLSSTLTDVTGGAALSLRLDGLGAGAVDVAGLRVTTVTAADPNYVPLEARDDSAGANNLLFKVDSTGGLTAAGIITAGSSAVALTNAAGHLDGTKVAEADLGAVSVSDSGVWTIDDNTVTSAKILDGTIAADDLADGSVTSARILDGTIAADDLADGSVTSAKILDGTIAVGDLADALLVTTADTIAANNNDTTVPTSAAVKAYADGMVSGAGYVTDVGDCSSGACFTGTSGTELIFFDADGTGTVGIADLTDARTWTLPDISGTVVTTGDTGTVTGAMIADATIAADDLAIGAVTSAKILDGTIAADDLADGSVTGAKILDGTIAVGDLADALLVTAADTIAANDNDTTVPTSAAVKAYADAVGAASGNVTAASSFGVDNVLVRADGTGKGVQASGIAVDDSDAVSGITQLNVDNLRLDGNTVSSTSGAVGITPLAGQNLNVSLSTTGDLAVNTDQLYVDTSTGYVGVGTAAPSRLLHVNGNAQFGNPTIPTGTITPLNVSFGGTYGTNTPGNAGNLKWDMFTSPGIRYGIGMSVGLMEYQAGLNGQHAFFVNQGTEAMRIKLDGKVGIGTTAPSAKLHTIATTEQARFGYDTSNYYTTTVGSTGGVTFDAVGSGSAFTFNDIINASGFKMAAGASSGYVLTSDADGVGAWAAAASGDVTGVGDCASGDCLDGSSDGGTQLSFYDAEGVGVLGIADLTDARTWTLPDISGTVVTTGDTGTVTGAMIADATIAADDLATGSVTSAKILDGTIAADDLATGSVTSAKILDGTIAVGDLADALLVTAADTIAANDNDTTVPTSAAVKAYADAVGAASGNVTAASSFGADNVLVRADGTGKGVQASGITIDDSDVVSGVTQLNVDNLRLDGNTVSSTSGAVGITPLAGQNLNVSLSTTGDLAVNTDQLYVDTSTGYVGVGTTAPSGKFFIQSDHPDRSMTMDGTGLSFKSTGSSYDLITMKLYNEAFPRLKIKIITGNFLFGGGTTDVDTNLYRSAVRTLRTDYAFVVGTNFQQLGGNSYFTGNLGIGTTAPSAKLHAIATTEQARFGYDDSNYYTTTVGATGGVTFDAVGAGSAFTFNDILNVSGFKMAAGASSGYVLTSDADGVGSWATAASGDVTGVGDCASGDCLDGSSDGGTQLSFYDAEGVGVLGIADLTDARTWTLPDISGTVVTTGDTGTVTGTMIADATIAADDLATGSVTSAKILDGTIAADDLATGSVTGTKILDGTIAADDLADGSVTSAKILDGTIAADDLATGSVTSAKILDGTIAVGDLADALLVTAADTIAANDNDTTVPTSAAVKAYADAVGAASGNVTAASSFGADNVLVRADGTGKGVQASGITIDDSDVVSGVTQLNVDNLRLDDNTIASTSGAVEIAPLAGQDLNVSLSTTGDFAVNTDDFFVDTSTGYVGVGTATPQGKLDITSTGTLAFGNTTEKMDLNGNYVRLTARGGASTARSIWFGRRDDTYNYLWIDTDASIFTFRKGVEFVGNAYFYGNNTPGGSGDNYDLGGTTSEWRNLYLGDVGKIYFGLNQDTNLYRSTADTLRTNNSLIIDGSVGIGTSAPDELLSLGLAGTTKGVLSLAGDTSGKIIIQPASAAGSYTLTLPTNDGDASQVLSTDGSGVLSWAAAASGDVTGVGDCASGDCFTGSDGTTLTFKGATSGTTTLAPAAVAGTTAITLPAETGTVCTTGSVCAGYQASGSYLVAADLDTYAELNAVTADVTLTHNGLIDTYAELNTIVADATLTHNELIDTSAEIAGIVTDETGSGALVFGTSPVLVTPALGTPSALVLTNATGLPAGSVLAGSLGTGAYVMDTTLTVPKVIGGGTTTSDLTFQTTTDAGDAGADMHFLVGNAGATEAMTILNSGLVGVGNNAPGELLSLGLAGTTKGVVSLSGDTSGKIIIQPASAAGTYTLTLPTNDGDASQVLSTDGAGVLSWAAAASGDVTGVGDCASGDCFTGSDGTTLTFKGATSGTTTLAPAAVAGTTAITLPAETGTVCTTGSVCTGYQAAGSYLVSGDLDTYAELNTLVADATLTHSGLIDTSAEIAGIVTDETGSGALVFGTSPEVTTPTLTLQDGNAAAPTADGQIKYDRTTERLQVGDGAATSEFVKVGTLTDTRACVWSAAAGAIVCDTVAATGDVTKAGTPVNDQLGVWTGDGTIEGDAALTFDTTTDVLSSGGLLLSGLTASEITGTDASKNLVSLAVATYPSLAELAYVKGVTSAIQTQLDAKGTLSNIVEDTTPQLGADLDGNSFDIDLTNTTFASQKGVITKGGARFIHNFNYGDNGTVTTAGGNTFIGENAGNLTMGSTATQTYHASYNTAVGYMALQANTTGTQNTANGYYSLYNNTTGSLNTANGHQSLTSNTEGSYNTANGSYSLGSTTGSYNTAMGYASLHLNTTGTQNTALGMQAGRFIADGSTGNTTGDYNVFLGYNTKALADNDQNEIVIGYNATGIGSNSVVLGNDSITKTALKGLVGIGTSAPDELLSLGLAGTTKGVVSLSGDTSGKIIIQPASAAGTYTLTLPTTDGDASQVLSTDGSGVLSWAAAASGDVTGVGDCASGDCFTGSDGTTLTFKGATSGTTTLAPAAVAGTTAITLPAETGTVCTTGSVCTGYQAAGSYLTSTNIDTYSELNTIVADATLTHSGLIDTSAEIAGIVTDETGSGALVFGTSPEVTTPTLTLQDGNAAAPTADGQIKYDRTTERLQVGDGAATSEFVKVGTLTDTRACVWSAAAGAIVCDTVAASGDVTKAGTPVNDQIGVWTGDGTIEGDAALTFDTTTDVLSSGGLLLSGLTASEIIGTDASKNLVSLSVATYPSLAELAYVKGVTSAIQTQLDAKGTLSNIVEDTTPQLGGNLDTQGNIILGGTGTTSDLTLQTTSGVGATGADMHFLVGNNGATEAMTILNSGNVGVGMTPRTGYKLDVSGIVSGTAMEFGGDNDVQITQTSNMMDLKGQAGFIFKTYPVAPWTEQMRINSTGNVGIGTTAPTAVLHLKAGTATAGTAPLKFTSGPLLTAPEAGAVEFLTDTFYGTITTGAARKEFYIQDGTDVAVADGGTGKSSWTQWLIPYADTTTSFSQIAIGTSGQVLTSNGAGAAPTFQAAASGDVTGVGDCASGDCFTGSDGTTLTFKGATSGTTTLAPAAVAGTTAITLPAETGTVCTTGSVCTGYQAAGSYLVSADLDTYAELNAVTADVTLTHNELIDTSAEIAGIVTDETGSGALVFGTSPEVTTPTLTLQDGNAAAPTADGQIKYDRTTERLQVGDGTATSEFVKVGTLTDTRACVWSAATGAIVCDTVAATGDVTKAGTPVNDQLGVWTGDGTIEGDAALTFDTTTDVLSSGGLLLSGLTASEIIGTDASKNLVSLAVATYPSLAELAYVKGVTSAIQTQLDAKGTGTLSNIAEDTTPQLGGDLDGNSFNIGLTNTTFASQKGVITKGGARFIHNFNYGNNGTVTTDGKNTFIGEDAGNFTMGSTATLAYQSSYNAAIGYRSLYSNTTGFYNVANGAYSLYSNTTGGRNTAYGYKSLYFNTEGVRNSANGDESLRSNTTGNNNTANGVNSLYSNTTGSYNVGLGYNAGYGDSATVDQRSVIDNYATFIGYQASRDASVLNTVALTNITAIGKNARVGRDNSIVLGGTGADAVNVGIGNVAPDELLSLGLAGTTKGVVSLSGDTSGKIIIQPASAAGTYTLTLPTNDGDASQVLSTDGSGVLSWATAASGDVTGVGDCASGDCFTGSDGTTLTFKGATSGTTTLAPAAVAGTTAITLPAETGTVCTTGSVCTGYQAAGSYLVAADLDTYAELNTLVADATLTHSGLIDTSAEIAGIVTDETGSGALVFAESPTLVTPALGTPTALVLTNATGLPAGSVLAGSLGTGAYVMDTTLTVPKVIGGGTTTSDLTFQTTTDAGEAGADMHFLVGNAGATEAMTILNSGLVGIGTTAPGELLSLGLAGTTKGVLSLAGNTSGKVIIQPASAAGTYTLTLPTNDGDASQVLSTDGAGVLSWAAAASGDVTGVGDCTGGDCFTGSDGTTLTFKGATSGTTTLAPAAVAGTTAITLPAETGTVCTTGSVCTGYQAAGSYLVSGDLDTYAELNTLVADATLTHSGLIDTSAEIAGIVTDETGSGALVFGTSPEVTTPTLTLQDGNAAAPTADGQIKYDRTTERLQVGDGTATSEFVKVGTLTDTRACVWSAATGAIVCDTVAATGDVTKAGTPVNDQLGVWTGDGTIEGDAALTFDTTTDVLSSGGLLLSGLTASEIIGTDASKNLVSLAVATYPSLAELAYVKGVTSAIQTQLDAKGTLSNIVEDTTPQLGGDLDGNSFNIGLTNTTFASQKGVITKGGTRFIHNFNYGDNGTVTTAGQNTFIGEDAGNFTMGSTATGDWHASYNTAVGYNVLLANTTGYANTATGHGSLYSNTTGSSNTATGYGSLYSDTTGYRNTAIGRDSLYTNIDGNYNTALGYLAGRYIADGTTANTTGDYNIFIGDSTKALADNDQNEIVIGYDATGIGSNSVVLGNNSITKTALKGSVGIGTTAPGELLSLGLAGTTKGVVSLSGDTSGKIIIQPASAAGTYTLTLPTNDGDASQVLSTDGSGVLSWAAAASGDVTGVGDCTGGDCFTGSDGTTLTFKGATSGTTTLAPAAVAGTTAITLPAETGTVCTTGSVCTGYQAAGSYLVSGDLDTYAELNTLVADATLTHSGLIDTSAEIAGIVTDETGSGALVFGTSPEVTTPTLTLQDGNAAAPTADGQIKYDRTTERLQVGDGTATSEFVKVGTLTDTRTCVWSAAAGAIVCDTVAATGDVTKAGTPVNDQIGVWTGDGTIEGDAALTFDTTTDVLSSGGLLLSGLTASEIIGTDASKNLVSLAVATYPSLAELAYVKGVTSAIQTQLDAKGTGTLSNIVEDTTPQLGGNLDTQGNIILGGTTTTSDLTIQTTSDVGATGADMHFLVGNNGATEAMTILNSGYVGIGTTGPGYKLDVNGDVHSAKVLLTTNAFNEGLLRLYGSSHYSQIYYNDNGMSFQSSDNTRNIAFKPGSVTTMTIKASSNSVGIGYTDPGTAKLAINGNVGIGTTAPTAVLHLKAGTATAGTAPLKLTSGTLLTAPEAGAVEFLTDTFYGTITTGAARKEFYIQDGTDVAVADGGTGKSSWTQWLIPYADTTTSFSQIAIGTSGQVLTSNGAGAAPTFQDSAAGDVTGVGDCASGDCFTGSDGTTLTFKGATSGTTTLAPAAVAGTTAITLPAETGTVCTTGSVCTGYQAAGSYLVSGDLDTYAELNTLVADATLTHSGLIDTSAEIAGIVTDETGSGALVFGTSPEVTTPTLTLQDGNAAAPTADGQIKYDRTTERLQVGDGTATSEFVKVGTLTDTRTCVWSAATGAIVCDTVAATGDVTAASSFGADNVLVRADGTGKGVQASGITIDDSDVVSGVTQLNVDNLRLDGNTVSSTSGAVGITPLAGQNLNVSLSTTGDLAVNTDQLYVDTSTGYVGVGTASPYANIHIYGDNKVFRLGSGNVDGENFSSIIELAEHTNADGSFRDGGRIGVISTNGQERLFLHSYQDNIDKGGIDIPKSTGYVGIGTAAPGELLSLGLAGTTKGVLSLSGDTSGKIIIQPASAAGTYTLTLPTTDGDASQVLSTDGAGVLSWATAASGDVTGVGDCASGDCFTGSDGTTLTFKGATSGTTTLAPAAVAGTTAITLPAETGTVCTTGSVCTGYQAAGSYLVSGDLDTYAELNTLVADATLTHSGLIDTSAEIAGIVTDETGSGALVFGTSPEVTTPTLTLQDGNAAAPTADGQIKYDRTTERLQVGDGTATSEFVKVGTLTDTRACVWSAATGAIVCDTVAASGDVTAASAFGVDNVLVRADGTGKGVQASGITIDDSNNLTGVAGLTASGNIELSNTTTSTTGVITKGGVRFIHNFQHPTGGGAVPVGKNTFVGVEAGNLTMGLEATSTAEASYNTALGYQALTANTTGSWNTANGYQSLFSNTTGFENTAVGMTSLYSNITGLGNTAIGNLALYANTAGNSNTAIGYTSLYNNTGSYNTALGSNAGRFIADGSTPDTTGDYNVFLGYNTKALADNDQNEIVIGYNAIGIGSNSVVLGNNSITKTALKGSVGIGTTAPGELLSLGLAGTTKGVVSLSGDTSGKIIIQPASAAGSYTLTLPTTDGDASQVLSTDGSGVLSWATAAAATQFKAFTLEAPANGDDVFLFKAPAALTLSSVACITSGGTSSSVDILECAADGTTCVTVLSSAVSCDGDSASATISDTAIASGAWVSLSVGAVTGVVRQVAVTIAYQ